jgi:hypothetical protein
MQESITVFDAQVGNSKTPYSPYGDNTFIFTNYHAKTNLDMYSIMAGKFILNIPLAKIQEPVRTFRRKKSLEPFYDECITYFILDIDDVTSIESQKYILDYFKDYKVIIGESRSYDGIANFNMKGFIYTDCIAIEDAKSAVSSLHHDLANYCTMDESVSRRATLNAPMGKTKVLLNNEEGERFKFIRKETIAHINEMKTQHNGREIIIDPDAIHTEEIDSMEKLCLNVFKSMGYEAITSNQNGSITFKHPSEVKSIGGYFWFATAPYTMHHGNSVKAVNIFDAVRKLDIAKELLKKDINYNEEFLAFNTDNNVITVDEKYLKVTPEVQNTITNFLNDKEGLLSIKSPMGTGKSTIIAEVIEECHDLDMRVLIITNRISVAKDFAKKYSLKLYSEDKYHMGDSFVVQYDSLWKFDMRQFDIVIMDEFISLMVHTRSNLNNSVVNISKFFAAFNKKLVIADAFLTGYENFLLDKKKTNLHLIDNAYRDPTTLYDYVDNKHFVDSLIYHAGKHKITVSATSSSFISKLQLLLQARGLKVVTLEASTPESTKELIYGLFESEDHDKWDVLIFSPTLTVGVSNLNNVRYHFHYDSSQSTDVISSIQMLKRTRKTKEIHMYVKPRINYIKTSYNDIRDDYMGNIGRNVEQNYLFDIDDYGEAKLSNIGKKSIKIDTFKNILEFNHKEAMDWLLKYHFRYEARKVENVAGTGDVLMKYHKILKHNNELLVQSKIDQFLLLNDIEKTDILMSHDSDKTMRALAQIDSSIKECPPQVKVKILECCLVDTSFIKKCELYRITFNYTKKIWEDSDIKNLISKSIIEKSDNLHFYNTLLAYGQIEIFEEYLPKNINRNKKLKFLLDKCGYGNQKMSDTSSIGSRIYTIDPKVKTYYGWIK